MAGSMTNKDKRFAQELLEEVGLGDKLHKFPDQLSGGERQRTAIARAFMNDPSIILADEPTASLDTQRAFEVVQLISHVVRSRNKASIMVTHGVRLLKYFDRVYRMSDVNLTLLKQTSVVSSMASFFIIQFVIIKTGFYALQEGSFVHSARL